MIVFIATLKPHINFRITSLAYYQAPTTAVATGAAILDAVIASIKITVAAVVMK